MRRVARPIERKYFYLVHEEGRADRPYSSNPNGWRDSFYAEERNCDERISGSHSELDPCQAELGVYWKRPEKSAYRIVGFAWFRVSEIMRFSGSCVHSETPRNP